ncbi:unnamed protein product [Rotaria sp. Silwood2]|nr:unnamed protein product [Rotaria sp. Silwood2]CAF4575715.1 unnamed protein product [Rotaria sp. Silwood2]
MEHLIPCKDSIYCLDQYSPQKSLNHNQTYSYPCRFPELCRNIHDVPHSIQFTHNKHDVPQCKCDMNCSNLTDPAHRFYYRHAGLPNYLIPCWNQQQCQNLYEGITICHSIYSTPASRTKFTIIATATDGNSSIVVYDPPATSTEGRLCLDCDFTKLYRKWDSAGTARYIVNASCWLLGIEKRLKQKK